MEIPGVQDFLPEVFLFNGTPFAINRFEIIRLFALSALLLFFGLTILRASKRSLAGNHVPTKPQVCVEALLGFVKNTVIDVMGEEHAKKWIPMITTIFCTVLFFNLTGIIPGLNLAATAGIGIPLLFGLWVFTAYWRVGISSHGGGLRGFGAFVKAELIRPGVPVFVLPINIIVEILQLLIIRPVSLAVRLFANMMAGHILLGLCFVATQYFAFVAIPLLKPVAIGTFAAATFFVLFEAAIAILQAYIFALLSTMYLALSFKHEE